MRDLLEYRSPAPDLWSLPGKLGGNHLSFSSGFVANVLTSETGKPLPSPEGQALRRCVVEVKIAKAAYPHLKYMLVIDTEVYYSPHLYVAGKFLNVIGLLSSEASDRHTAGRLDALRRLEELRGTGNLEASSDVVTPTPKVLSAARAILAFVPPQVPDPHVAASDDGDVFFIWIKGDRKIEIMMDDDGVAWLAKFPGDRTSGAAKLMDRLPRELIDRLLALDA